MCSMYYVRNKYNPLLEVEDIFNFYNNIQSELCNRALVAR